jgi:uncharacterized protein (TIGR03435 family)
MIKTARQRLGALIALGSLACITLADPLGRVTMAQSPAPLQPESHFEVASVKPAPSTEERRQQAAQSGSPQPLTFDIRTLPGGRFVATHVTLKMLIEYAYDIKGYQIDGGPPWLTTDYFDINAIGGVDATPADIRVMLKALLAERFALRADLTTRDAPAHVLTVARADGQLGSRLTRTSSACEGLIREGKNETPTQASLPRLPSDPPRCGVLSQGSRGDRLTLSMSGLPLERLVATLSRGLGAPVIDRTGLSGLFDVSLEYLNERRAPDATLRSPTPGNEPPPPLAVALREQLGLKLDRQTAPLPMVLIEAAQRPTPN